jgi:hypothetical protein
MSAFAELGVSPVIAEAKPRPRFGGQYLWILVAILTLAAVVRVGIVGRSGLWADELFSLAIATGHSLEHPAAVANPKLGDFVQTDSGVDREEFRHYLRHDNPPAGPARVLRAVLLSDTSPPLYYLLLYGWTLLFGTSDVSIRMFSVTCSLACFPLLLAIARRTGGKGAIIPAGILFALSPLAIYYSTEARMYSLLWLCVLAVTWASLALHRRGETIAMLGVWVAASVSGFLTHYFFVFPWLAIAACLVISRGRLKRWQLIASTVVTGVLILPWYVNLPKSLGAWRVTQGWLNWRPRGFSWLVAILDLTTQFFDGRGKYLWPSHRISTIVALILFGTIAVVMVWRSRMHLFRPRHVLLWLPFVAICVGPLVFDFLRHTYTVAVPRYAIAALPAACLLTGVGLACLKVRTRIFMLVVIALAWSPNLLSIYRQRSRNREAFREVSRAVSSTGTSSDLILVHSIPSGVLGIARYANGPAAMASWVGQLQNHEVPGSVRALAAGRNRIFLVKIHEVGSQAAEEDWLRANAIVSRETHVGAATIVEFRQVKGEPSGVGQQSR